MCSLEPKGERGRTVSKGVGWVEKKSAYRKGLKKKLLPLRRFFIKKRNSKTHQGEKEKRKLS